MLLRFEPLWRLLAWLVCRPAVRQALIRHAMKHPYFDIHDADGQLYMRRWWLVKQRAWLPFSARIHYIMRPDRERDLHDHPWNFRTIVLQGYYFEATPDSDTWTWLQTGDTAAKPATGLHTITDVSFEGVWTLFIMGRWRQVWGFNVGGQKVDWRTYLRAKGHDI